MQDLETQVLEVTGQKTQNGKDKYNVKLADGNTYTTFKLALAQKAGSFAGTQQQVTARVDVKPKQDGNGVWLNLEDIGVSGSLPQLSFPVTPGTPIQTGQPVQAAQTAAPIPVEPFNGGENNARMARSAACKVAFGFIGNLFTGAGAEEYDVALGLAKALTEEVLGYTQNGPGGGQQQAAEPTPPVEPTPENVAAAVPGVEVGTGNLIKW